MIRSYIKTLALLLIFSLASVGYAQQATNQMTGTLPQETPIRSGPSTLAPQYEITFPANSTVNVIARDFESDWYFVRLTGNVLSEGWIQDEYLQFAGVIEQGTAAGFVSGDALNLYLQPDTDNTVVRTLDSGTEVVVSGQDATGTWYFLQRPDGAFDWAPASDVTLTEGNPAGIPIWYTVPSERTDGSNDMPSGTVFDGVITNNTNAVTGIYGTDDPQIRATLTTGERVSVIAFSNIGDGYYLVRTDTGLLAWVAAQDISVNGQVPVV